MLPCMHENEFFNTSANIYILSQTYTWYKYIKLTLSQSPKTHSMLRICLHDTNTLWWYFKAAVTFHPLAPVKNQPIVRRPHSPPVTSRTDKWVYHCQTVCVYSSDSARIRKANAGSASHFQFMSGLSSGIVGLLPVILSEAERRTISLTCLEAQQTYQVVLSLLNRHISWSWASLARRISSLPYETDLTSLGPHRTNQLFLLLFFMN